MRLRTLPAVVSASHLNQLALIDIETARISLEDYSMPLYDPDEEIKSGPPQNAVRLKQMMTALVAEGSWTDDDLEGLKTEIDRVRKDRKQRS